AGDHRGRDVAARTTRQPARARHVRHADRVPPGARPGAGRGGACGGAPPGRLGPLRGRDQRLRDRDGHRGRTGPARRPDHHGRPRGRAPRRAGPARPAPPAPDLAAAAGWGDARRQLAAFLTGRLAEVAGARTFPSDSAERGAIPARRPSRASGSVAAAVEFAGAGAVRYALARLPPGTPARVGPCQAAARHLGVPAYAVRYAHAHAVSTLRQAADLGLSLGEPAEFQPRLLAHPSERSLLDELSWLAERVAGAARRARPDAFARYLERLAGAYFDCQEQRPAVWPGMTADGPGVVARLWLAATPATALRAGLDLLGVDAPDRL